MPYFINSLPHTPRSCSTIQPPEMIHVEGGIVAMGNHVLAERGLNSEPRLVWVDSFSVAPTCVTVGQQREVFGGKSNDKAPTNYPGLFSFEVNEAFCRTLSDKTGQPYGIGTEAEWEYAARDRIDDVRLWMEQHPELGLKTISDLRAWLFNRQGWLENFVVLGRGEKLTLGSRLVTDPNDPSFVNTLSNAARISCWTVFSGDTDLTREAFYFDRSGRGQVGYGKPNQKGIRDMTGGMIEWCADVYRTDTSCLPPKNPFNAPRWPQDPSARVQRGGGWGTNDRRSLQVAYRDRHPPHESSRYFGARLFGPA